MIWRELEQRGEDLSDLRSGLAIYLPLIASGELEAEFVIKHAGQHMLLQAASKLPISLQRQLLIDEKVEVVDLIEGGQPARRMVSLNQIKVPQINRAFREGGLRSPDEQLVLIGRQARHPSTNAPKRSVGVRVDGANKTLKIGNREAPLDTVLKILSSYYDVDLAKALQKGE
jgi:hypothetical protein